MIQLEHEKALEEMKQKTEMIKLEREQEKLKFINQGKISGDGVWEEKCFNVGSNLQLLLKFSEKDPDLSFSLFERVAESRGWSDGVRTLLPQCVLAGKA